MASCKIGQEGGLLISEGLGSSDKLKYLNLNDNHLGDAAVTAITKSFARSNFSVQHLKLAGNNLSDKAGEKLAYSIGQLQCMQTLDLRNNDMTNASGILFLSSVVVNKMISKLSLLGNMIPEQTIEMINARL